METYKYSFILAAIVSLALTTQVKAQTALDFSFAGTQSINGDTLAGEAFQAAIDGETSATVFSLDSFVSGLTITVTPSQSDISFTNTGLGLDTGGTLSPSGDAITFSFNQAITFDYLDVDGFTSGGSDVVTLSYSNSNPTVVLSAASGDFDNNTSDTITFSSNNSLAANESFTLARTDGTFSLAAFTVSAVPEPSSYAILAGMSALGFVVMRRRRA